MSESSDVRIARLEEQFRFVIEDIKESKTSRKIQYETMESMSQSLTVLMGEVADVKNKLAGQAPTIEEFITIKHKVVGAGAVGKWLWVFGGLLLGAVGWFRENIGL